MPSSFPTDTVRIVVRREADERCYECCRCVTLSNHTDAGVHEFVTDNSLSAAAGKVPSTVPEQYRYKETERQRESRVD